MKFKDTVLLALSALRYRKLRTTLTMLGVIIGTSLVIILTSQTAGLSQYFVTQVSKTGLNSIFVMPARGHRISAYDIPSFSMISGVKVVVPIIRGPVTLSISGKTVNVIVTGIDSNLLTEVFPGLELAEGVMPGKYDFASLLVGANIANPIEEDEYQLTVGQTVNVAFRRAQGKFYVTAMIVMGILESYGSIMPFSVDDTVVISLEAADSLFNKRHYYDALILIAEDVSLVDQIIESVNDIYGQNVRVIAPSQIVETMNRISSQISTFLGLIAAVSLIVASIGIANIMYISVIERTRLIGLLKALGATELTIMMLFMMESTLIGLIGGAIGIATGIALSYVIGPYIFGFTRAPFMGGGMAIEITPVFSFDLIVTAFLIAVLSGVIAGIYPARKAAKLDPVVALRQE
ncbi:MAG: ABC transporter permease [archaeon GB-1867-035]|nr:ABC transporter permease [Candidatus Culexmicrobium profundum]